MSNLKIFFLILLNWSIIFIFKIPTASSTSTQDININFERIKREIKENTSKNTTNSEEKENDKQVNDRYGKYLAQRKRILEKDEKEMEKVESTTTVSVQHKEKDEEQAVDEGLQPSIIRPPTVENGYVESPVYQRQQLQYPYYYQNYQPYQYPNYGYCGNNQQYYYQTPSYYYPYYGNSYYQQPSWRRGNMPGNLFNLGLGGGFNIGPPGGGIGVGTGLDVNVG
uniref:Candidate secreted effector n=1 Tax=Meloidogyne incognita TaxID=6306 RepID=A0A914MGV1_MELIC